jgi:hypothetical protein
MDFLCEFSSVLLTGNSPLRLHVELNDNDRCDAAFAPAKVNDPLGNDLCRFTVRGHLPHRALTRMRTHKQHARKASMPPES